MKPRQIKKNSKSAMDLLIRVFGENENNFSLASESMFIRNKKIGFRSWVIWTQYYDDSDCSDTCYALFESVLWENQSWNKIERPFDDINKCSLYPICNFNFNELIKECRKLAKAGVKFR